MKVAQHINDSIDCDCWFWWEWDVLPIKKDCFAFLLQYWTEEAIIMGYHVQDYAYNMRHKINSVAFYDKHYWTFFHPYFERNPIPFDQVVKFSSENSKLFVPLNKWFLLLHHEKDYILTPSIRLIHGVKDDRMLEQLLGKTVHYKTYSDLYRRFRYTLIILFSLLSRLRSRFNI